MTNKYPGLCHNCGKQVKAGEGTFDYPRAEYGRARRRPGQVTCPECFNKADNSGPEDRCCGNAAFEDACARACGL